MAVKTKADVIVQLDLVVASLNSISTDAVLPSMAPEMKDPRHPLRQLKKLFKMSDSGTYSINTAYLDQVYDVAGTAVVSLPAAGSRTLDKTIP